MAKRTPESTRMEARRGSPRRINVRFLIGALTLALIAGVVIYASMVPAPRAEKSVQPPDPQPDKQPNQQPGEIR